MSYNRRYNHRQNDQFDEYGEVNNYPNHGSERGDHRQRGDEHPYSDYEERMDRRNQRYDSRRSPEREENYRRDSGGRSWPDDNRAYYSSNQRNHDDMGRSSYHGGYNQGGYGRAGYDERFGNAGGYGNTGSYSSGHNFQSFSHRGDDRFMRETPGHRYYNTDDQRGKYFDQGSYQHQERNYGGFDNMYDEQNFRHGNHFQQYGDADIPNEGEGGMYSGGVEGMGRSQRGNKWKRR